MITGLRARSEGRVKARRESALKRREKDCVIFQERIQQAVEAASEGAKLFFTDKLSKATVDVRNLKAKLNR